MTLLVPTSAWKRHWFHTMQFIALLFAGGSVDIAVVVAVGHGTIRIPSIQQYWTHVSIGQKAHPIHRNIQRY